MPFTTNLPILLANAIGGIPETTKELVEFLSEGKEIDVQTKPNGMLIVQIPRCSR